MKKIFLFLCLLFAVITTSAIKSEAELVQHIWCSESLSTYVTFNNDVTYVATPAVDNKCYCQARVLQTYCNVIVKCPAVRCKDHIGFIPATEMCPEPEE